MLSQPLSWAEPDREKTGALLSRFVEEQRNLRPGEAQVTYCDDRLRAWHTRGNQLVSQDEVDKMYKAAGEKR